MPSGVKISVETTSSYFFPVTFSMIRPRRK